jgi:anti-sigma B factor antagonist
LPQLEPPPESSFTPSAAASQTFECAVRESGRNAAWIRVSGELDIATGTQLEQTLREALGSARLVVVDLRQLTFMDSTGVHLMIEADARARRSAQRLVRVRGPEQIDRLFDLVGLTDRLEIVDLKPVHASAVAPMRPASPATALPPTQPTA